MAKLTMKIDSATVADSTGAQYINKSGIYDVTINFINVHINKTGSKAFNISAGYNGNPVTFYGPTFMDKDGKPVDIGWGLLMKLGVIAGMENGDDLDIEEETHKVGKDGKAQTFDVITNFSGMPVRVRLQRRYSRKPDGDYSEGFDIKSFFRAEDSASAEEITKGEGFGTRYELEKSKYADNITYAPSSKGANDAPTPEEIEEWLANKAAAKKSGTPKPTVTSATKPVFGAKFGAK